jgi:hypothetical protein
VPYLVSGAMVEPEDGPIIFGISRDIATRKQMEGQLVAAREAALAAARAKVRVSLVQVTRDPRARRKA